jgi:hypothetical protein
VQVSSQGKLLSCRLAPGVIFSGKNKSWAVTTVQDSFCAFALKFKIFLRLGAVIFNFTAAAASAALIF